jgi:hypothetical protein
MTTISVPPAVAEQLRLARTPLQLVDERGHVLGNFAPAMSSLDELSSVDELSPEELAELRRRMASPGPRYSTEQVLEHLSAVEKS